MLDVKKIRNDFPMLKNNPELVYFDNGATSLKPQSVIDEVVNFYSKYTSNIHRGDYDVSFKVSKMYEDVRKTVSKLINCDNADSIVFTSGSTASLNIVSYGYVLKNIKCGTILTTYAEHASNILPLFRVAKENNLKIEYIPLNADGTFNIDEYKKCFDSNDVKFVALPMVSNVLGYIYPIKDICKIAHEHNALVSVDGAQAVPHIKVDVKDLDVDFMSFSAHKMLGPSGVGVLYGKYELLEDSDPTYFGGGANARFDLQQNIILKNAPTKFEAGTPNIEGVLGLNSACKYLLDIGLNNIEEYDHELIQYLLSQLSKLNNIQIINPKTETSIVSFVVKDIFSQDVASYLNKFNIAVRSGNHCAKLLHNIIGRDDTIRVSLYFYNTKEEIDKLINVLKDITLEKCIGAII